VTGDYGSVMVIYNNSFGSIILLNLGLILLYLMFLGWFIKIILFLKYYKIK
jgi:hypothetical protein